MSMFSISFLRRHVRPRDGLAEGVQVHHEQVDGLDAVFACLGLVGVVVAQVEQTAVDARVQRLDAAGENLGKTGVVGHVRHGDSALAQASLAVPPVDRISTPISSANARAKGQQAGFIGQGDQGTDNFHSGEGVAGVGGRWRRNGWRRGTAPPGTGCWMTVSGPDGAGAPSCQRARVIRASAASRIVPSRSAQRPPSGAAARVGKASGVVGEEFDFGTHGNGKGILFLYASKPCRAQRRSERRGKSVCPYTIFTLPPQEKSQLPARAIHAGQNRFCPTATGSSENWRSGLELAIFFSVVP